MLEHAGVVSGRNKGTERMTSFPQLITMGLADTWQGLRAEMRDLPS